LPDLLPAESASIAGMENLNNKI